jgi:hypothetical protein
MQTAGVLGRSDQDMFTQYQEGWGSSLQAANVHNVAVQSGASAHNVLSDDPPSLEAGRGETTTTMAAARPPSSPLLLPSVSTSKARALEFARFRQVRHRLRGRGAVRPAGH